MATGGTVILSLVLSGLSVFAIALVWNIEVGGLALLGAFVFAPPVTFIVYPFVYAIFHCGPLKQDSSPPPFAWGSAPITFAVGVAVMFSLGAIYLIHDLNPKLASMWPPSYSLIMEYLTLFWPFVATWAAYLTIMHMTFSIVPTNSGALASPTDIDGQSSVELGLAKQSKIKRAVKRAREIK